MKQIMIVLIAMVVIGCSKEPAIPSPLVVVQGKGIPGIIEVGMTVKEVRVRVSDTEVGSYPCIRYPWQVKDYDFSVKEPHFFQARSLSTRKFWEKPKYVDGTISRLGLRFAAGSDNKHIESITFWSFATRPSDWITGFTGELSSGQSFARGRNVYRNQIIKEFGEPAQRVHVEFKSWLDQREVYENIQKLLKQGKSFSELYPNGVEHLHYPTNGIMFTLNDNKVSTFKIKNKVEQSWSTVPTGALR